MAGAERVRPPGSSMEAPHTHRRRGVHSSKSTCGRDPRATEQGAWKTICTPGSTAAAAAAPSTDGRKPELGPGGQWGLAHAYGEGRPDAGHSTDEPRDLNSMRVDRPERQMLPDSTSKRAPAESDS